MNLDPGQDLSCKRNVQRCVSANRLSFSELFDDISFVLNVRRLCVVVDCIISAAKVCDSVISAACRKVCGRVVELFRQNILCCNKNVSLVFRFDDCAWEKLFSTQEN